MSTQKQSVLLTRRKLLTTGIGLATGIGLGAMPLSAMAGPIPVPSFNQADPQWANFRLGNTAWSMANSGCLITSLADIYRYYGVNTDPGKMVQWFNQQGGFDNRGYFQWLLFPGGVTYYGNSISNPSRADIAAELNAGYPVLVQTDYPGYGMHFVVFTGITGSTYYMCDPVGGTSGSSPTFADRYTKIIAMWRFRGPNPAPAPGRISVNLQTSAKYMTMERDGTINVNRPQASQWELFFLTKATGGALQHEDKVTIQSYCDWYLSARYEKGHLVFAGPQYGPGDWEHFQIYKVVTSGGKYVLGSGAISQGNLVTIRCSEGEYLSARFERTNSPLSCDKNYFDSWEVFQIQFR